MAGRTRRKRSVSHKIYQDVSTQTSPNKDNDEIQRMREEINSMRQELNRFKQIKDQNSIADNPRKAITVVAAADSPREQQKISVKGCNCRGKCSSKVCGCVKKQVPCSESCKCHHARCQNKDPDKENNGGPNVQAANGLNLASSHKIRETVSKAVAEGAAGPSNKNLDLVIEQGRSVFSPESSPRARREWPLGKMTYNETLEFTDKRTTLNFDSDSSLSPPDERRKIRHNANKDSLKLPTQANGLSNSKGRKKRRLFTPHYNRRNRRVDLLEPTGVESLQSPVRRKLVGNKGKAEKIERVQMQVGASANENLEQREVPIDSYAELDLQGIDPMKPTRQLQRTPTLPSPKKNQLRVSQVPLPRPKVNEEKEEHLLPPPKEIDEPLVNWEEHCAQLVPCKLCHRTFYPFRLKRHQASCKKV